LKDERVCYQAVGERVGYQAAFGGHRGSMTRVQDAATLSGGSRMRAFENRIGASAVRCTGRAFVPDAVYCRAIGTSLHQRNARSMISCCSTACTFDEPDDGADMARREMRLIPVSLPGNSSGSSKPNRGHAPWLAGSSCTQKYSLTFG